VELLIKESKHFSVRAVASFSPNVLLVNISYFAVQVPEIAT
jgi:hypothetical protein